MHTVLVNMHLQRQFNNMKRYKKQRLVSKMHVTVLRTKRWQWAQLLKEENKWLYKNKLFTSWFHRNKDNNKNIYWAWLNILLLKIGTKQLPNFLPGTLIHTGAQELLVAGLRALRLSHLMLPLLPEGVAVQLAHVVQDAAGQYHGGNHVESTVVPLAQTLPARSQFEQRLLRCLQRSAQLLIKALLWLCWCLVTTPPTFGLWIGLH